MTTRTPPIYMYALPNLITLSAMGCGLTAVTIANDGGRFGTAAIFVMVAAFLDLLDGRIARMTGTQSEFGVQLDSLSDAISFGAAPALMMYTFALSEFGTIGLVVTATYTGCAIVRLARFNLKAGQKEGPGRFMMGLSVPASAAILVALVGIDATTDVQLSGSAAPHALTATMLCLGALMVSTVPFRSYKDLSMNAATIATFVVLLAVFIGVSVVWSPAIALGGAMAIYVAQGFVEVGRRLLSKS